MKELIDKWVRDIRLYFSRPTMSIIRLYNVFGDVYTYQVTYRDIEYQEDMTSQAMERFKLSLQRNGIECHYSEQA